MNRRCLVLSVQATARLVERVARQVPASVRDDPHELADVAIRTFVRYAKAWGFDAVQFGPRLIEIGPEVVPARDAPSWPEEDAIRQLECLN